MIREMMVGRKKGSIYLEMDAADGKGEDRTLTSSAA